jgi:hypothetical protein
LLFVFILDYFNKRYLVFISSLQLYITIPATNPYEEEPETPITPARNNSFSFDRSLSTEELELPVEPQVVSTATGVIKSALRRNNSTEEFKIRGPVGFSEEHTVVMIENVVKNPMSYAAVQTRTKRKLENMPVYPNETEGTQQSPCSTENLVSSSKAEK